MGSRSTNKTVYSTKYHVIWRPKYRRWVLAGPVETQLEEIIGQVAARLQSWEGRQPT